jgi:anti-anti-sigma factor
VSAVRIEETTRDGCVIVALHGALDAGTAPFLQHLLLKRLSERPLAVVCDLAGLEAIDVICATVFSSAARPAARWPDTALVLAAMRSPIAAVLDRARVTELVPRFATVDDAIARHTALPGLARSS